MVTEGHPVTEPAPVTEFDMVTEVLEVGAGRPVLLLHGGGGPFTTALLAQHLGETTHVIAPTHPGFNGTAPVPSIAKVRELADAYAQFLIERDLRDVIVVGSSVGGWLAAELALGAAAERLAGIVIINGLGIEVEGHPILDVRGLAPQELATYSFHEPSKLRLPPPTPEGIAIAQGNAVALAALTQDADTDSARLAAIHTLALVIWGASDKVVDADYGRAYAAAIPGAMFVSIPQAGHLPHLENAAAVFAVLDAFMSSTPVPELVEGPHPGP
jgi:pimeloyl-ACP methyl ester carboxylesterase